MNSSPWSRAAVCAEKKNCAPVTPRTTPPVVGVVPGPLVPPASTGPPPDVGDDVDEKPEVPPVATVVDGDPDELPLASDEAPWCDPPRRVRG
jgi:hypothetical protein